MLGDLYLTEKLDATEFTEEDEHLATLLAAKISAAIENARLHEDSARLLEEVQRLHRARERFFAMVNHELRNALAAVYGWGRDAHPAGRIPRRFPERPSRFWIRRTGHRPASTTCLILSRLDEDRLKPVMREVDCGGRGPSRDGPDNASRPGQERRVGGSKWSRRCRSARPTRTESNKSW